MGKPYIKTSHVIIEIVAAAIVLAAIVFAAVFAARTTGRIAVHYNLAGEVDGYGSPSVALLLPIMMLVTLLVVSLSIHLLPKAAINLPVKVRPEAELRVYTDAIWSMVTIELILAVYSFAETIAIMSEAAGSLVPTIVTVIAVFADIVFFIVKIVRENKVRKES